ncbi:MAG: GatB/YqeY domain-containing protein [Bacteroidia bacterium]
MTLEEKINADIKAAMLAKDTKKLEALRAIKSEILLLKSSEKGTSEDAEMKAMMKMVKQRKESADIYKGQNRPELAEAELFQVSVIESFLPKQMSAEELEAAVKAIMAQAGASTMADMGKVMGVATKQLAGKAEGKAVSEMVKKLLSGS